jgi:hypothetical protein
MASLLTGIRGTVQGVIGATDHVLWWVSWHSGGADRARAARAR